MKSQVYISGVGMISALGDNTTQSLNMLRQGRTGIQEMKILDSVHRNLPVGEVGHTNEALLDKINHQGPKLYFTRTSLLASLAVKEALGHAEIEESLLPRTGLILGTSVGGMDRGEKFYKDFSKDFSKGRLRDVVSHGCGGITEVVADSTGLTEYITTISTACSSAANALITGARLIRHGIVDRVVAGGSDGLTTFTLNGFNTLKILDSNWCRPFDDTRQGLNLGEAAGFVVLESEASLRKRNKEPLAILSGFGNTNDAHHQTASSPDGIGAQMSMQKALKRAALNPEDIDYINVHGTGTSNNDQSEGTAVKNVFKTIPPFSSTKSFTGHTLGAAGGIEAIISILSINEKSIFPNLNFSTPIEGLGMSPVSKLREGVQINHVLSNSLGFGGNCTTLLFSRV